MRPIISGSQLLNLPKKRINKKEIMEANEGKYTFGAVISVVVIWVEIFLNCQRDFLFSGLSCFSGLFKRGHVPSFTYVC